MGKSISSDLWEKNKALIAKLYMEEEWPLKHVIKQICSDEFSPSETQLRSRLKKWRVIKPSRVTRKKAQTSTGSEKVKGESPSAAFGSFPTKAAPTTSSKRSIARFTYAQPRNLPPKVSGQGREKGSPSAQQLIQRPSDEPAFVSNRLPVAHVSSDISRAAAPIEDARAFFSMGESLSYEEVAPIYSSPAYHPSSRWYTPSFGAMMAPDGVLWPPQPSPVNFGPSSSFNPLQWYPSPFQTLVPSAGDSQYTASASSAINAYPPHIPGLVYRRQVYSNIDDTPEYPQRYENAGCAMETHYVFPVRCGQVPGS